ncbi:MAG: hypothetical protein MZW92_13570 [Comamonadaceae bacterium]|nr:hypothetical protein [Comamonadaceae bacterium]
MKRNLATAALVAATVTALQGCFAVVATGVDCGRADGRRPPHLRVPTSRTRASN